MAVFYPTLAAEIARRGVKKSVMARQLGITPRTMSNKLEGKSEFFWSEAETIQRVFFPDIPLRELFLRGEGGTEGG